MKYDIEYFENTLRLNSKTAEEISHIRWDWIKEISPHTVLDYGSGAGWFRAYRPNGVKVCSYDIGPFPQTGIELILYDVVCFWDVLEHIPDFSEIKPVLALSSHVAVSVPIVNRELFGWKHFKPSEHIHYWSEETFKALFREFGFESIKQGQPECPPRKDIHSFLFRRSNGKVGVSEPI